VLCFCAKDTDSDFGTTFLFETFLLGITHLVNHDVLNLKEAYFLVVAWVMLEVLSRQVFFVSKRTAFIEKFDDIKSLWQVKVIVQCFVSPFWRILCKWKDFQNWIAFLWGLLRGSDAFANFELNCSRGFHCVDAILLSLLIITITSRNDDLLDGAWHNSGYYLANICVDISFFHL